MHQRSLLTLLAFCLCTTLFSQEPKLVLPLGMTSFPTDALFSPDGKKIVTASIDGTVQLWDAFARNLLADLKGHKNITSIQFSPACPDDPIGGKKILMASGDGTVIIWDVLTTNLLIEIKAHKSWLNSAAFSTDGKKIVTASYDHTAKIWDAATGNLLADLIGHSNTLLAAEFSPACPDDPIGGKKIVTASLDQTAMIWDAATGKRFTVLKGQTKNISSIQFDPESGTFVTTSGDSIVKIRNILFLPLVYELKGKKNNLYSALFSPDGKKIVTASYDHTAKIWDAATGKLLVDIKGHQSLITYAQFSPACPDDPNGGKKIVTTAAVSLSRNFFDTTKIWDAATGNLLAEIKGNRNWDYSSQFSPDGKKIINVSANRTSKVFDVLTGNILFDLQGHASFAFSAQYSPDGKKFVQLTFDRTTKIWDAATGIILAVLKGHSASIFSAQFSPACPDDPIGGKKIVTASRDSTAKIWDAATGNLLADLKGHTQSVYGAQFSPDGKKIVTYSTDQTAKIWDGSTGNLLADLIGHTGLLISAQYSPACPDDPIGGKRIVTASHDGTAKIWDAATGNMLANLKGHTKMLRSAAFSPDGKKIVTAWQDGTAKIWSVRTPSEDASTGNLLADLKGHTDNIWSAQFSPACPNDPIGGKIIVTVSEDNTAKIWDAATGNLLADLKGHKGNVVSAQFSPDGKKIITSSIDKTSKTWEAVTGDLLYTFFAVDSTDYLVFDKYYRYDGTPAARKLLYFTCGTEVIELDQVKDQLWVPNLAERILNGETINAAKLSDLNICNLTPLVETIEQTATQYLFQITPRLGGLGATIVYVNGIEVKRYTPQQLIKQKEGYQLAIDKKDLQKFFVSGKDNSIVVKTLTEKSSISSRSGTLCEKRTETNAALPNLYAVVVGISDYKGEELDLNFAAKDAVDIAKALDISAKKLLNTDGREHVFITRIHTGAGRDKFPEKKSIRDVFKDIADKAKPNDILLIFFAGHGVMSSRAAKDGEAEKNQFYFLTAVASGVAISGALKDVGISTEELTEWIKPQVMKAQKRILIFDACNSGQAIKEMISIGQKGQNFLAARGDDKSKQIKAVEKLNERSGLFILSASASDQKAYEMGKYNQGALTYSLLKAIKEEPDILEDRKYLNISRWFNAAEKTVGELSRETGARQQPQIVSTTNFNIGVVDEEVRNTIVLPFEKPMFTRSDFRNVDLRTDNLKLRTLVDKELGEISENKISSTIMYSPEYDGANVYAISGDYTVKGNEVIISVILTKGGTDIKSTFEIKGPLNEAAIFSKSIVAAVMEWIKKK